MGTIVFLTSAWVVVLRRRVRSQTDLIEQRLQREQALKLRYRDLFESNPQPMWVYDLETLEFLAVNAAAIQHYGYAREEFLRMTIKDIRAPEAVKALLKKIAAIGPARGVENGGNWKHRR